MASRDLVVDAFSNAVEELGKADFATLYSKYNNTTIAPTPGTGTVSPNVAMIGSLLDPAGNPARVSVTFHVNETNLPEEYGPVGDLDGDGNLNTANCSATYHLLPAHLSITFQTSSGLVTSDLFVLLGSRN
jgi:hypothetical protein